MANVQTVFSKPILHGGLNLNAHQRFQLAQAFWHGLKLTEKTFNAEDYTEFFNFINSELDLIKHHGSKFAAGTFGSMTGIIKAIQKSPELSREKLVDVISHEFLNVDRKALRRSIELALRLWLTLNVRSTTIIVGPLDPRTTRVEWDQDISITQLIASQFARSKLSPDIGRDRLDQSFTAAHLVYSSGIKIRWSSNLADHLQLDNRSRILSVYQHKICLINHLESSLSIYPKDVLEEALDTINLLFPMGNDSTRELLLKEKRPEMYSVGLYGRPCVLDLSDYNYWKNELMELWDAYNEPPRNWRQLLLNRRNKLQWVTFWIAIIIFGLTLIGLGLAAVTTAYAIMQYNLALAQACSAPGAVPSVLKFCSR